MTPWRLVAGNTRVGSVKYPMLSDLVFCVILRGLNPVWHVWKKESELPVLFYKTVKIVLKSKEKRLVFKIVNPDICIGKQGGGDSHLPFSVDSMEQEPLPSHLSFKATSKPLSNTEQIRVKK